MAKQIMMTHYDSYGNVTFHMWDDGTPTEIDIYVYFGVMPPAIERAQAASKHSQWDAHNIIAKNCDYACKNGGAPIPREELHKHRYVINNKESKCYPLQTRQAT